MMDITVGMFFISSGAGNGLGPPPHSGIETKANVKNVLAAKQQWDRTRATDRLGGVQCCDTSGNDDLCEEGCFCSLCCVESAFFSFFFFFLCSKVRSVFYCSPKCSERMLWRGAFIMFSQQREPFCSSVQGHSGG